MKSTVIVLAGMALMIAGCGDKGDSATEFEKTGEPETEVVMEEVEVVTDPGAGDSSQVVEEVAEEVDTGYPGQGEEPRTVE
jgi:PBP1b-binding outer membrane lipoprotein LpoB